jgi:hypothetical protein
VWKSGLTSWDSRAIFSPLLTPKKIYLEGDLVGSALLFVFLVFLYFVPWLNSLSRKHNNAGAIAVLNFFLGWTIVGWIGALIWSMTDNVRKEAAYE